MRISTKKLAADGGALRVHLDGRPSPLLIAFDAANKEWDLCTEQEHIMSTPTKGRLLSRLETLAAILVGGAG